MIKFVHSSYLIHLYKNILYEFPMLCVYGCLHLTNLPCQSLIYLLLPLNPGSRLVLHLHPVCCTLRTFLPLPPHHVTARLSLG